MNLLDVLVDLLAHFIFVIVMFSPVIIGELVKSIKK